MGQVLRVLQQQQQQSHQLIQSLRGGWRSGGASAGAAGGGGGGGRRGAAPGPAGRPGDWTCAACGAYPCFARSVACFRCKAPRADAPATPGNAAARRAGGGGGVARAAGPATYLGPIGANGSRPMLGRRGQPPVGEGCPTTRVPGTSAAARAEAASAQRSAAVRLGDAVATGRQGAPHGSAAAGGAARAAAPGGPLAQRAPVATANRWAPLADGDEDGGVPRRDDDLGGAGGDDDEDCRDERMEDVEGEDASDVDEQVHDESEEQCSAAELRQVWQAHCAAYRLLEKEGHRVPPELLAAAREQRDGAERRWRDAKPPHPLHKRLRWAEVELRDALAKEAAHRQELQDHLDAAARRTSELEARLAIDEARSARKREALRNLQGGERAHESTAMERAARMAATGICLDVAPVLSTAIENLGDGAAEVRQDLQLAVVSLSRVEEILREAAGETSAARRATATTATHYDIGDSTTTGDSSSAGSGSTPTPEARTGGGKGNGAQRPVAAVPRWTGPDRADGKWGGPAWKRQAVASLEASKPEAGGCSEPTPTSSLQAAARAREQLEAAQQQAALAAGTAVQATGAQDGGGATAAAAARGDGAGAEQRHQEEERRVQEQRQETMRRQQEEIARARAAEAEREAREKQELLAKLSPEELRRAAELHNQQAAIAAAGFGTHQAAQGASIVHQQQVQQVAQGAAANGIEADADALMGMSAEELAEWGRDAQQSSGQVPW